MRKLTFKNKNKIAKAAYMIRMNQDELKNY